MLADGKKLLYQAIVEYFEHLDKYQHREAGSTENQLILLGFYAMLKNFELPVITEEMIDKVFDDLISSQLRAGMIIVVYLLYQIKEVIMETKENLGFNYLNE